jgi:type I restriction enzyme R subunit
MSNFQFLAEEWPDLFASARKVEQYVTTDPIGACIHGRRTLELAMKWLYQHDRELQPPYDETLSALIHEPSFRNLAPAAVFVKAKLVKDIGNRAAHEGARPLEQRDAAQVAQELFHILYWLARTYTRTDARRFEGLTFNPNILTERLRRLAALKENAAKSAEQLRALEAKLAERERQLEEQQQAAFIREAELAELQAAAAQAAERTVTSQNEEPRWQTGPMPTVAETAASTGEGELSPELLAASLLTPGLLPREGLNEQLRISDAAIARVKQEIAAAKQRNSTVPDAHDYSEAQTRDYFIDLLLREAGWLLSRPEDREFKVQGMPGGKNGFVDYVLWGDDGLPLAVVEAKRTKKDARVGRQQAKLYADCLEARYGVRPIIFYTNGYEHWLWDDANYPPRVVQGFYKKDELQLLIQRRTSRKSLANAPINAQIVERYYQTESIRSVTQTLEGGHRKALIVMATGAGKTRTVIALADVLQRCNWAKRILFLADRRSLVKQAANAFKTFLPETNPVNLLEEKEETGSRVFVSTYPTMMGLIDQHDNAKSESGESRRFGPGHFDLIIIDEAHRSVYQKYRAIFEYFDSLLVGLTATPKAEVDKNTYSLFDLESGMPTYAYELDQAVSDGFLVPPVPISVPLKFMREGITYADLSEEDKEAWEALEWEEEEVIPDRVEPPALNKWLFNKDTIEKVLAHLMTNGLKVAGGDRLGKTIIFAKSHLHAMAIEQIFNENYPAHKGTFARVIDNYEPYAQHLLDEFSIAKKEPHIAISVDMLDTGIDVPEVLNLVFFKMVRSKTKFFQMIGRGTRLRPDLFGPGLHKDSFVIFDYCQNLEYFNQNAKGVETRLQEPLGKKLFLHRLELLQGVRQEAGREGSDDAALQTLETDIADTLHAEVASMNIHNFVVRPQRKHVEQWSERGAWDTVAPQDATELAEHVAGLPSELDPDDESAKRFDLIMLKLQLAILNKEPAFERLRDGVREIASGLEEKRAIPMINAQMELILELQTDEYWQDVTLPMLDTARKRLRDLVKFIDKYSQPPLYTNFEDEINEGVELPISALSSSAGLVNYRKKVMQFLEQHESHPVLQKLKQNRRLLPDDIQELESLLFTVGELGSREEFEKAFGPQPSLGKFIRSLVGLDREAAKQAFGEYLNETAYNTNQIRFVNHIIDYLTKNGTMELGLLYQQPFTYISPTGLDGVFSDGQVTQIAQILSNINQNAMGLYGTSTHP